MLVLINVSLCIVKLWRNVQTTIKPYHLISVIFTFEYRVVADGVADPFL